MSAITTPEIVIYNTLESAVKLIREDLKENAGNEKDSILYKILGLDEDGNKVKMNRYVYFEQAKKMFETTGSLSVNFGYNLEVAKIISMHILLPSEVYSGGGIGQDEGYQTEDVMGEDDETLEAHQQTYTQMFDSVYQIMITSVNSSEVNIVYNVLKSVLLMLVPHLELLGLRIPKFSGNDVVMNDEYTPIPIFHKVLNISFTYELTVPKLVVEKVAKKFVFKMKALDYFDEA